MIHLNLGSNLNSKHGSRFDNISIALNLLLRFKIKIKKFQIFMKHHLILIKIFQIFKCWIN
jgi:hypothetical protein